ncbi:hypothetical protein PPL_07763 [Heterostelium album PN500]|uniref:Uncharacterized protein n=1 Tax=Heterostelium pallidum (strain ATCC 26659 / Pp 5 / PN500) TaxID=670386 RepID=D3BGW1_HETP5|nr:hypothetical protein PPL_07763 [Heterostelium album PN500]EFA79345.1 hypothetical protein PPL_07763 [Heterostelium album PN500]|eukprot:XP_020431466.1 hypothetical protein PPL_07763 [Heterostelium album PN500]
MSSDRIPLKKLKGNNNDDEENKNHYLENIENTKKGAVKGFGGEQSPEENALFSLLTWDWLNKFVWFCYRNVLEQKHIWNLAKWDKAETLNNRMRVEWEKEMKKPNPSYTRAGFRAFGMTYLLAGLFQCVFIAAQFVGPEMLSKMITFIMEAKSNKPGLDLNWGYYYALIIFCTSMVGSICLYKSNMMTARVGDYMRSVIVCDVYQKSLRLSNSARSKTSTGEIVNLMSNDAQRMIEVFGVLNNGLYAPLQLAVCVVLLYLKIKWITFVALGFMLLMIPINSVLGKRLLNLRRAFVKFTDLRVKATNEILQSIKVIKLYSWEDSFTKRVSNHRDKEVDQIFKFTYARSILVVLSLSVPTIVSMLVFSIYYKVNSEMKPGEIFAAIAYLNILRTPLIFLPFLISLVAQLKVATKRVTDFLMLPELDTLREPDDPDLPNGIYIEHADVVWNPEQDDSFHLDNLDVRCSGASLTMVVGSVGSGKSTLCQAMLGELSIRQGSVRTRGSIAYVSQQAWIINASLRDNILFGRPMDEDRYHRVIECCSLEKDLEMFPQGDLVEIGERGINLSGGQKQRVSIARAVYNDADIYIFDDPLSAVDAHVGKHLFYQCFKGVLKNKTVILSTNQLQYLPHADHILVMKSNCISERGNYQDLMNSEAEFSNLIREYGVEDSSSTPTNSQEQKEEDADDENVSIEMDTTVTNTKDKNNKKYQSLPTTNVSEAQPKKLKIGDNGGKLISQEEREEGSVSNYVYFKYFTAGGIIHFIASFIFYAGDVGSVIFMNWWLSYWSDSQASLQANGKHNGLSNKDFLYCFIGIGFGSIVFITLRCLTFYTYCVKVGRVLHEQLFHSILSAPMWFFDTTPLGRIINRFTRDIDSVDNLISTAMGNYIYYMLAVVGTLAIISSVIPKLLIILAPVIVIYYLLQNFYRHSSRELQRLVSISRSPIFAHFSETLNGVSTIRAYKCEGANTQTNMKYLDTNNSSYLLLQACMQWLGLRLDLLGPKEAPQIIESNRPVQEWPQHGGIVFENLVMRYREGLDPVLKGISCEIKPKERIGIVGRTGAGKSSIVLALFRLVESSQGRILIDGQDISKIGLKDLRKSLSIIPQDPVMFSGTLRENLDPFVEYTDAELWELLESIQLAGVVRANEGGLLCKVTDNGENWSVGQRQLICLGRALLRRPKILVLDEATASVDAQTDQLIQQTIRSKFSDCTILTIAHRLNTIMDSDRILVLDSGRISELDTPIRLLDNPDSILTWLVNETVNIAYKFICLSRLNCFRFA